jgi:hypothetical protein
MREAESEGRLGFLGDGSRRPEVRGVGWEGPMEGDGAAGVWVAAVAIGRRGRSGSVGGVGSTERGMGGDGGG